MAVNSCRNSGKGVVCSLDHLAQVDPDTRLSAKEILEAKWFTEDVNTVNYALEVGRRHGNPSSELLQSFLLQVMGLRELDTTSLEGTLDQDREDSGENLNIAPTMVHLRLKCHFLVAKLLKMLWEYMDLTVLPFIETWSAHIFGGWQRVCWSTNEAFNQASPTKEF